MNFIWSNLSWKGDTRMRPSCFANQWISQDIPSLSSQSECTKMDILCLVYTDILILILILFIIYYYYHYYFSSKDVLI